MRQEGILLALVETVHLVDKDDGAPLLQPVAGGLRLLHRLADVLDAAEHRADGDEQGVEGVGHQPRDGGFAHARRPPEDAAVRLAGLERQAQRHALTQQLPLADHLAERAWTQAFGQGLMRSGHHARQGLKAGARSPRRAV
jgi:hypothetical protein